MTTAGRISTSLGSVGYRDAKKMYSIAVIVEPMTRFELQLTEGLPGYAPICYRLWIDGHKVDGLPPMINESDGAIRPRTRPLQPRPGFRFRSTPTPTRTVQGHGENRSGTFRSWPHSDRSRVLFRQIR
jgi:hypothetical protein